MKPKRLTFTLIVVGMLTSAPGCFRTGDISTSGLDGGEPPVDTEDDDSDDDDDQSDGECMDDEDCWDDDSETDGDDDDMDTDTGWCSDSASHVETYVVPEPPAGVEPDVQTLCEWDSEPVESNRAARVTLNLYSQSVQLAEGRVDVEPELLERIVGLPVIQVIEAHPDQLMDAEVTDIQPQSPGFSFHIEMPDAPYEPGETELSIQVVLELDCADISGDTQMVESTTFVHLCESESGYLWISSGDDCSICYQICEMAPCPIPAAREEQLTALAASPRAEIAKVARWGRMLLLFAEHRGTRGKVSYLWKASGGTLSDTDTPGVIWRLPADPNPHLLQLVVQDDCCASVALLRWQHKA